MKAIYFMVDMLLEKRPGRTLISQLYEGEFMFTFIIPPAHVFPPFVCRLEKEGFFGVFIFSFSL
jgi:hypothetical protein